MKTTTLHPLKQTLIASLLMAGISNAAHAGPILLQDAYTAAGANTSALNYGNNPSLNIANGKTGFMRFAVNSYFPAGTVGNDISKATLKVFVNSFKTAGNFNVYAIDSTWSEASINANNQPTASTLVTGPIAVSSASSQQWVSIDITNQVKDWLDGTENNNGLALVAADGINVFFDSKENTTSSHAPEIEISLAGVPGPKGDTGAAGEQGIQGLQGSKGDTGATGLQGEVGPIGPQGLKGDTGAAGEQGIQGLQGPKGDTGATGLQGEVGPIGPQGLKGDKGDAGAQGIQGLQGTQGLQGPQGDIGPIGPQGEVGPTGPQGIQGLQGSQGTLLVTATRPSSPNIGTMIYNTSNLRIEYFNGTEWHSFTDYSVNKNTVIYTQNSTSPTFFISGNGVIGADNLCNSSGEKPQNYLHYRALLSSDRGVIQHAKDIVTGAAITRPVTSKSGIQLSANWAGLWDGSIDTTLSSAGVRVSDFPHFTGSSSTGNYVANNTCGGWTRTDGAGIFGSMLSNDGNWVSQGPNYCGQALFLLCVAWDD